MCVCMSEWQVCERNRVRSKETIWKAQSDRERRIGYALMDLNIVKTLTNKTELDLNIVKTLKNKTE